MTQEQKDKVIKLSAYITAKVCVNEKNKKYSNVRLVHYGIMDILNILDIKIPLDNSTYGNQETTLFYEYLNKIKKDDNFFPKGFEKNIMLSN